MIGQDQSHVRQHRFDRLLEFDGDDAVVVLEPVGGQVKAGGEGQHHPHEPVFPGGDELRLVRGNGERGEQKQQRQRSGVHKGRNRPLQ